MLIFCVLFVRPTGANKRHTNRKVPQGEYDDRHTYQQATGQLPANMAEVEQTIKRIPGLEQAGKQLANSIHSAVLQGGSLTRAIADALHGTWFGHPLHPALTDIPIGAWALAAGFDAYAGLGGGQPAERTADTLIAIGVVAAVPTALAGMADYSAMDEDAIAVGTAHALLNSAGLGLYLLSMWARAHDRRGLGVVLSTTALGLVGASAGLGGDMIYRRSVGVNHAPPATVPTDWMAAPPASCGAHGDYRCWQSVGSVAVRADRMGRYEWQRE